MLNSTTFSEGCDLQSKGTVVIPLSDDSEALIILMYIVHGIMRKVPRSITLDTLTELACLTDYYQLHEAVEFVSDTWIASLKQKAFPKSLGPAVIPWLFISWVFRKRDEFKKITCILENESDDRWVENVDKDLIIPDSIVRKWKLLKFHLNSLC
jgi:hypothetical protein